MLTIVLPVYNQYKLTKNILKQLDQQIIINDFNILLIDNNSSEVICDLPKLFPLLDIEYIRNSRNIGINPSWNQVVNIIKTRFSDFTKYILFMHNDIYINSLFLEKMIYPFEYTLESNCGIVVPNTVDNIFDVYNIYRDYTYTKLEYSNSNDHNICGWAFCIKNDSSIINTLFPLPVFDKLRYGDKYIYDYILNTNNYDLIQMETNFIHHKFHGTYDNLTEYEKSKLISTN